MKISFLKAVPLVFFLLLLVSCSNAQSLYDKGNYQGAINRINKSTSNTASDYLLKAKCHIAQNEQDKALESLLLFLMTEDSSDVQAHQFAVSNFLKINHSDKLTLMVIKETDGTDALKALYCAYSRNGDYDSAKSILQKLSDRMDFESYVELILSEPVDPNFILDVFYAWYVAAEEQELDHFLLKLEGLSRLTMTESEAKRTLSLTDVLMANEYYTSDNLRLSTLLKIKGNILEKLFDKVNARIYWSQAYKLNPEDEELGNRLK